MIFQREQRIEWRRNALQQVKESETAGFIRAAWAVGVNGAILLAPHLAEAAELANRINRATAPIRELVTGAAYPVAYVMISCGFILVMCGKREAGFQIIRNGAIGFLGLQFVGIIMGILVEVASAIQQV